MCRAFLFPTGDLSWLKWLQQRPQTRPGVGGPSRAEMYFWLVWCWRSQIREPAGQVLEGPLLSVDGNFSLCPLTWQGADGAPISLWGPHHRNPISPQDPTLLP